MNFFHGGESRQKYSQIRGAGNAGTGSYSSTVTATQGPRNEVGGRIFDDSTTVLGFWTYLMTDSVLFASLFATYAVLRGSTYGGAGTEIFDAPFVLVETLLLLFSSFTCGLALLAARVQDKRHTLRWLSITGVLGALFVALEVYEFAKLIMEGHGPQASAFLSSYFTLVGTHGLHVTAGLLWLAALALAIARTGLHRHNLRKLVLFAIFWHFLDLIWIFVFTIVYMMGIV